MGFNVRIRFTGDAVSVKEQLEDTDEKLKPQEKRIKKAKEDVISLRQQAATILAVVNAAVGFIQLFSELSGQDIRSQFAAQLAIATLGLATAVQFAALSGASGNIAGFIILGGIASGFASLIAAIKQGQVQVETEFAANQLRSLNLGEDL